MSEIDETHDPRLKSLVATANASGADFPIQNLPYGSFRRSADGPPRIGVAIGDQILDLRAAAEAGLLPAGEVAQACGEPRLNRLMALGAPHWSSLRRALSGLLRAGAPSEPVASCLVAQSAVTMDLPASIGDFTDFFASIHHATNAGRLNRPDNPLLPNYKYVPVAYHGRSSSFVVDGTPVRRPSGQRKPPDVEVPSFGPCRNLDYETEMGFFVGPGNPLGTAIPIGAAGERIFGACLLNDWSARDIQAWEYQPLGPFLAKNFATSISPWIVTIQALAPFRTAVAPRPDGDPAPLPHLFAAADQAAGAFDVRIEVTLMTAKMRAAQSLPHLLSRNRLADLYWTPAQMIAHHTSNGCNLMPGDVIGTGTLSGPTPDSLGGLLEITRGGREPITLSDGEVRRFLEDGDEVMFRAHCERDGFVSIGFGTCRGLIAPAVV